MPLSLNVNGQWKNMDTSTPGGVYVNINGVWKVASEGWININGTWKKIFPEGNEPIQTISAGASMSVACNGSYFMVAGSFNLSGTVYAFAKSKSNFNANYIIIHTGYSSPGYVHYRYYSWSIDGETWTTESGFTTEYWSFHGANLFSTSEIPGEVNCATSIAWNGTVWVGGGWSDGSTNSLVVSSDGETWIGKGDTVLRINTIAWSGNTWCAAGQATGGQMNVIYSSNANANTWTVGTVKPFTDVVYDVQNNGAQWMATGKDTGSSYSTIKSSNVLNSWVTQNPIGFSWQAGGLGLITWDGGNNRWVIGGLNQVANDGGIYYATGDTGYRKMNMGTAFNTGKGFMISNNRYLYVGIRSPIVPPDKEYHVWKRNNADNAFTYVHGFSQPFGFNLMKRVFATRYAPFAIPPLV